MGFQKPQQFLCLLIIFLSTFHLVISSSNRSLTPDTLSPLSHSTARCSPKDSFALLQFNRSLMVKSLPPMRALPYAKTQSWKKDKDCCSWDGVTCDTSTGYVTELDVSNSMLQGVICPNSSIFRLDHLQKLNLALNDFGTSQISSFFGRLSHLTHLNLSSSGFSGQIPKEISLMSKLISLDLSANFQVSLEPLDFKMLLQNASQLEEVHLDFVNMSYSMITESLAKNLSSGSLKSLSLRGCELYGEFPRDIFMLPNIRMLELSYNPNLKGTLPNGPERSNSSLEYLNLSHTSFGGTLPNSTSYLYSLEHLDVSACLFSGHVPESIGNFSRITRFVLSNNRFSGQLPSTLAKLEQVTFLNLVSNDFEGPIPDAFATLRKLTAVTFADNNFQGSFPASILNVTQIYSVDFSQNHLTGAIPSNTGDLPKLTNFNLSDNSLNGTIPPWIFALPSLRFLDLQSNQFRGQIQEFQFKALEVVSLGYNQLHGPIPLSIFQLVNLTSLSLQSCKLNGVLELDMLSNLQNLVSLRLANNTLSLSSTENSCNLPSLQTLDLSRNQIHGQLPSSLWAVGPNTLTDLNLSHNFITDIRLPWTNLIFFDITANLLQGVPIPPPTIHFYSVSANQISGEIPSLVCNFSSLLIFDLSSNSFSGELPKCLGNVSTVLSVLDLRRNHFTGAIPEMFERGNSLRSLSLNQNKFEGPVPRSLLNCTSLELLDLGNNKINGTFPHWLDNLPKLRVLILRSNEFSGTVESSETKRPFPKLRILDLSHNNFSGILPALYFGHGMMIKDGLQVGFEYMGQTRCQDSVMVLMKGQMFELVKILKVFTIIDLSMNKFQGEIPESIGKLRALQGLNLSNNFLTGDIPKSIADLGQLEFFDLSSNKLEGQIPSQLTSLNFLSVLNLSNNHLTGSIPRSTQFDTFGNDSYAGNLELCGFPLTRRCENDEAAQPTPEKLNSGKESDWKSIVLGYASGLIIGLVVGQLIFWSGKPQWFNQIVEEWCRIAAGPKRKWKINRMHR